MVCITNDFFNGRRRLVFSMKKSEKEQLEKTKQRLESGELIDQPCWAFIKELNSCSEESLDSVAITDGYRQYT